MPNELYTFNNQSTIYLPASQYSVESISVSGTAVTAEITCGDSAAAALCASYSPEGKMLSIDRKPLRAGVLNEVIFTHAAGASRVKVFVVDETGVPLCASRELKK